MLRHLRALAQQGELLADGGVGKRCFGSSQELVSPMF